MNPDQDVVSSGDGNAPVASAYEALLNAIQADREEQESRHLPNRHQRRSVRATARRLVMRTRKGHPRSLARKVARSPMWNAWFGKGVKEKKR